MEKKGNFDGVFIRDLLIGARSVLTNKITWNINTQTGKKNITAPVHLSMTGDERFLLDAFVDDYPDQRVELNTDQKQRIMLIPKSWNIIPDEFANPNVYISKTEEIDNNLKEIAVEMKFIPFEIDMEAKIEGANSLDIFIMFQLIIKNLYMYKNFTFIHNRLPLIGTIILETSNDTNISREFGFKDDTTITMSIPFKLKSVIPIYDINSALDPSKRVNWTLEIYDYSKNE